MKRGYTGAMVVLAVIGSGLILFSGGRSHEPDENWQPLNAKIEQKIAGELGSEKPAVTSVKSSSAKDSMSSKKDKSAVGQMDATTGSSAVSLVNTNTVAEKLTETSVGTVEPAQDAPQNAVHPISSDSKGIHINTASVAELVSLPGVGEKKAQAIIDYRNQYGPFRHVNDLDKVKGIGPKMLEKMKPYVTL